MEEALEEVRLGVGASLRTPGGGSGGWVGVGVTRLPSREREGVRGGRTRMAERLGQRRRRGGRLRRRGGGGGGGGRGRDGAGEAVDLCAKVLRVAPRQRVQLVQL